MASRLLRGPGHRSWVSGAQRFSGRVCVPRQVWHLVLPSLLRPQLGADSHTGAPRPPQTPDWCREDLPGPALGAGWVPFP